MSAGVDMAERLSIAAWIGLALWAAIAIIHAGAMFLTLIQPVLARWRRRHSGDARLISCLLPVSAADEFSARCFESLRRQHHPSFEMVVCSDSASSPGMEVAQTCGDGRTRFVVATERRVLNPKIDNLLPALDLARGELILIKDSNIEMAPGHLAAMADQLAEGVGLVCSLPVARAPGSFAAWFELAIMNGRDAPFTAAATVLGMTVGYGKVMLLRRRDLERIGGFAAVGDVFGDDHALALALDRLGLRTVYTAQTVSQPLGSRTWRNVIDRQIRWMVIRREQAPLAFHAEPFVTSPLYLAAAALAAPLAGWSPWGAVLAAFVMRLGVEGAAMAARGWAAGWRYLPAAALRDATTWTIWLRALTTRQVRWAGQPHRPAGKDISGRRSGFMGKAAHDAKR